MRLTSIIIPTYNGYSLLAQCVFEIRRFTHSPYEIIVVDDGSMDETVEFCLSEKIDFVSFPFNQGFPSACNAGLKIASGDTLLLLNNDIVVSRYWLSNLEACLYSSERGGIVGPMTNYASGTQQHHLGYTDLDRYHEMTIEANRSDPRKWRNVNGLVGMSMAIKRELLDSIGYLDEIYTPGHYEDDDYCFRARQHGYELLVAGDTYIHHQGSASFNQYSRQAISELIHTNRQKFTEKFGVDPLTLI